MIEPIRLLAFAFAGADLLFEIDRNGTILFATGATSGFADSGDLVGQPAAQLFQQSEKWRFTIITRGLTPGERAGPLPVTLASGEKASLSMCFLPPNQHISCTLVKLNNRSAVSAGSLDSETGLADRKTFLSAASQSAGSDGAIALVNVPDLSAAYAKLAPDAASALMAEIGASMRAMDATIAGRLSQTSFGVVTENPVSAQDLAARIQDPARAHGLSELKIEEMLLSLKDGNLNREQIGLALRHVVGRFADGKLKGMPRTDLAQMFEQLMSETIARAQGFCATVADGAFDLAFEPIVDLKSSVVSHYEALTRFQPGQSPADTIRFAEDLGLADFFDLALAVKIFTLLESDPAVIASIAINVSGRSIASRSSFAMLEGLLRRHRGFAKRVSIEITETVELADLAAAEKAIQALRKIGYRVGIDDFGAGAATENYLDALTVDFMKVDRTLIERIGKSERDDAYLRAVLARCAERKIETIAEWIDNADRLKRCVAMGFKLGQGRHFGPTLSALPRVAREGAHRPQRGARARPASRLM
jgi:EAL domain-containing protein (putative c-di-GMP-specific phosphodiesterase class I)